MREPEQLHTTLRLNESPDNNHAFCLARFLSCQEGLPHTYDSLRTGESSKPIVALLSCAASQVPPLFRGVAVRGGHATYSL